MRRIALTATLVVAGTLGAHAEEGMWTFDHFPTQAVKKAYDFTADQAWLDKARLSSVRLAGGCSASSSASASSAWPARSPTRCSTLCCARSCPRRRPTRCPCW